VKIVESWIEQALPAMKSLDHSVLMGLYSQDCVFGSSKAGEPEEQKDVLMMGLKNAGFEHASTASRDSVKAMKVMSAVPEIGEDGLETPLAGVTIPVRITAWVKVEMGDCPYKGECKGDFYVWMIFVPFEGAEHTGWTCTAVLTSPSPAVEDLVERPAELMAEPAKAAGVASVPALVALGAAFASGALLSGYLFGQKELFTKLMAPRSLREPLL
jgi:hypothetical protein